MNCQHYLVAFGLLALSTVTATEAGAQEVPTGWENGQAPSILTPSLLAEVPSLDDEGLESQESPFLRWRWFHDQRAYPYTTIPPGALQQAKTYLSQSLVSGQIPIPEPTECNRWQQIGPAPLLERNGYPQTGRINTIAVDPRGASTVLIGAAEGGVWRTRSGGATWTALTDDQPSLAMGSIAIAPSDPDIIYAGTGDLVGYYGAGLLRSTDGGDRWEHIPGPFDTAVGGGKINKIVISTIDPGHIVIASDMGVFFSTDGGADITDNSQPTLAGAATDLAIHPDDPNIVYAALSQSVVCAGSQPCGGGIFRSPDGGQTWSKTGVGVVSCPDPAAANCRPNRTHLAIAPTNPDILYAIMKNPPDGQDLGVFRYDDSTRGEDGMGVWRRTAASPKTQAGFCLRQCWYNLAIAVQPNDPDGPGPLVAEDIVYAAGAWLLLRSTDGGQSWPVNIRDGSSGNFHVDMHALTFDASGALYVGSDGGIVMHRNPATAVADDQEWNNLNGNLAITQFYPGISVSESGPLLVLGGTQDNGVLEFTGSSTWTEVAGGDGGYTAIGAIDSDIRWISSGLPSELKVTTNGGVTWPTVSQDLDENSDGQSDFSVFGAGSVTPFLLDPQDPKTAILGLRGRVWRTTTAGLSNDPNCGAGWCRIGPVLPGGTSALAIAPSDTQTYYAGGLGRVHYTQSSGGPTNCTLGTAQGCWQEIGSAQGFPNRFTTDLAVHPTRPTVVYATVSGFCGANPCPLGRGHVFVNVALSGWIDISGNLPDIPTNAIQLDSSDPNVIYVGTDLGVFRGTVDSPGQSPAWQLFSSGLPNSVVFDLVTRKRSNTLFAATFGRSMFRLSKCPPLQPKYEYAADLVCGIQRDPADLRLANGVYATSINIHNPNSAAVRFSKKLALTFPPGEQKPGEIRKLGEHELGPDEALMVDCTDIQHRLYPQGLPAPYIVGFVVLKSESSLDVSATFSTRILPEKEGAAAGHSSVDVERIAEREVRISRERPDLIPVPGPSGGFCRREGGKLHVTVKNVGVVSADDSRTSVAFSAAGSASQPTPSLAVGAEADLFFF